MYDYRSDTVTQPTDAMRDAMMSAELGDDVLGDDPTVQRLEVRVAKLLGKEAACFVPSGTMANQVAIRAQTEPGDEIIAHEQSHIYEYEGGAPAALSGCSLRLIRSPGGLFDPDDVSGSMRPIDDHAPRSRLLVVENTHNRGGGRVWPLDRIADVIGRARSLGLRCHMDGARLMNACVAAGVEARAYASHFDTVSMCFSKGLGAPVGSAMAGPEQTVARARRFRKMYGGGMRQSGLLAAAAEFALEHHVARLAEDHGHAQELASGIAALPGYEIDASLVETNIVYFEVPHGAPGGASGVCERLAGAGVLMLPLGPRTIRAVTHLDVDRAGVSRTLEVLSAVPVASS